MAIHTSAMRSSRIRELFFDVFRDWSFPVPFLNCACFLQLVLDHTQAKAKMPFEKCVPTAFGAQFQFHEMVLMSREVAEKKQKVIQNPVHSTLVGMTVQLVEKNWNALTEFYLL